MAAFGSNLGANQHANVAYRKRYDSYADMLVLLLVHFSLLLSRN